MAKTFSQLAYINDSGFYVADYADFLEFHQEAFRGIYGQDVNLDPDTQDGQLLAHFAQCNYDLATLAAKVFNNFSPTTARGDALSRQVKINGITRQGSTASTVDLTLTGNEGTTILNGQVRDTENVWNLPERCVIPAAGEITVTGTCQTAGAIEAAAGTINRIGTPTEGWISVTNKNAATLGRDAETDAALRQRQAISVSQPSQSIAQGILGAIQKIDGVSRVIIHENATGEDSDIPAHSVALVVDGGDTKAIAEALYKHKTLGVATAGTTSAYAEDANGDLVSVNFYRPTEVRIKVRVNLEPLAGFSNLYENEIQEQVSSYISNLDFGATIYRSKMFVPANLEDNTHDDTYDITEITMARDGGDLQAKNISLSFNELAVCDLEDVEVVSRVHD
jgi:uncharacterized phage protein gp47/JayE